MLNNLKLLLGIKDNALDDKLTLIIDTATARLRALLGGIDPPESLEYIILEVSVMRFNRIGSEGVSIHSVEGESMHFLDSDFDAFSDDIRTYLEYQSKSERGRLRFL